MGNAGIYQIESPMHLILYSKPGCHLCEGLQEKLEQIQSIPIELEIRDITTQEAWFKAYEYEIPVLFLVQTNHTQPPEIRLPRLSPRASIQQVEAMLRKYLEES